MKINKMWLLIVTLCLGINLLNAGGENKKKVADKKTSKSTAIAKSTLTKKEKQENLVAASNSFIRKEVLVPNYSDFCETSCDPNGKNCVSMGPACAAQGKTVSPAISTASTTAPTSSGVANPTPNSDGCNTSGQSCTCSIFRTLGTCNTGNIKPGLYCQCNTSTQPTNSGTTPSSTSICISSTTNVGTATNTSSSTTSSAQPSSTQTTS